MKKIIIGILMCVLVAGVCLATVGCGEESLSGGEESLPGDWEGTRDETYSVTLTSPTHYINVDTGEYLGENYRYSNIKNIYYGEYQGENFYFCDGWSSGNYIVEETGFFLGKKVDLTKPGGYEFEYATIPFDTSYTNAPSDKWVYRWTGDLGNTGVAIEGTNNGYLYAKDEIENLTQLSGKGVFSVQDDEGEWKHILAGSINYTNYTATLPLNVSETCVWRFLETGECFIHYVQKFNIDTKGTPNNSGILGSPYNSYEKEGVIEIYRKGTYSILEDKVIVVLTLTSTDGIKYTQTEQQTIYQLSLNKKNLEFSYPGVSYTVGELTDFASRVVCYKTT